jgi:hypothetical protein
MGAGLLILALSLSAIPYHIETAGPRGLDVHGRFTSDQLVVLQKLNRADLQHLDRLRTLVVPDAWLDDELAYSPMPRHFPQGRQHRRVVVVYQPAQVFAAYEYGELVRWGPVSTGRRADPTPEGLFHLNWRKERHTSSINPDWIMDWAFNFENRVGLAFHEQELPGQPASHGCVRLLGSDARWLFEWADTWTLDAGGTRVLKLGTPVFILGEYDFAAAPPWQAPEALVRPLTLPSM